MVIPETLAAYLCGILVGVGSMVLSRYLGPKVTVALATYPRRERETDQ